MNRWPEKDYNGKGKDGTNGWKSMKEHTVIKSNLKHF